MAVYTEISDDELIEFVAQFDIGAVIACKGIAEGIENSNYFLVADRASYILTLYEKRVRAKDLPFFLGLLDYLAGRGVPCPVPVKGRDGEALRRLSGRPAAITTFLEGMWPRRVTTQHCAALGEAMARLQVAGDGFAMRRPNDLSLESWRPLLNAVDRRADEICPGLAAELAQELADLEGAWPAELPAGIIHADLFPDNVFFMGAEHSGFIDFYFACNDFLAYDLAICLNAWCFEIDGSFNSTKARRMTSAYGQARSFTREELDALPLLARGAAMRFLLTRLYDWLHTPEGALVTRKDPLEYYDKLTFHRGLSGPGVYGLE
jgi:homoserine kinase type II